MPKKPDKPDPLDKIFKAYDIRGIYGDILTEDVAWKIGCAAGTYFKQQTNGQPGLVLVSRDMRPSSESMAGALCDGIRAAGMNVGDLGMADTSIQYFAINHVGAVGGIQTTASHNPIEYNGFKISGAQAKPVGASTGLKDIQQITASLGDERKPATGTYEQMDLWEAYRNHIRSFLKPLSKPVKVFIDASNGMAGKLIPQVFEGIDNLEIIPLNFEITGQFAHEPNPLVAENMVPTQEGVKKHKASIGACFDGDADRCMIVDDKGETIGCDHLTAMLAHHFVALDRTDPTVKTPAIAYDLRSSKVVEETIKRLDAAPVRSKVGHVFMKAALREHQAVFGGELSGHFYFRDNYNADSGAITLASVLSVLDAEDAPLSQCIAPFKRYPQSGEINFEVEDKQGVMDALKQTYRDVATIDELDGVTIDSFDNQGWWFNVRASNTEPLLRLNAEAKDDATLKTLLDELTPQLGARVAAH